MALRALILVILTLLGLTPLALAQHPQATSPEVALQSRHTGVGKVYFVRVPPSLLKSALEVHLAAGGRGDAEDFSSFVGRIQPAVAVNGTYFSYSEDRGFTLVLPAYGDGVAEAGETERANLHGSVLAVGTDGRLLTRRLRSLREARTLFESGEFRVVLGVGPTLVQANRPLTSLAQFEQEGFSTSGGVLGSGDQVRVGAGITAEGDLLLASSAESVGLDRWAQTLHELGCVDAVNLDGGRSQGLYVRAQGFLQTPADPLTNIIVVADVAAKSRPRPDSNVLFEAARVAERAGDLGVAVERYREIVYHYPESVPGCLSAAEALVKQGNRASAAAFYARAGRLQIARGQTAASRRSLHEALLLNPGRLDVANTLSGVQGLAAEENAVIEDCLALGMLRALRAGGWGQLQHPLQRQSGASALALLGHQVALPAGFRAVYASREGHLLAVDASRSAVLTLVADSGHSQVRHVDLSGIEFAVLCREVSPGLSAVLALPTQREAEGWQVLQALVLAGGRR